MPSLCPWPYPIALQGHGGMETVVPHLVRWDVTSVGGGSRLLPGTSSWDKFPLWEMFPLPFMFGARGTEPSGAGCC